MNKVLKFVLIIGVFIITVGYLTSEGCSEDKTPPPAAAMSVKENYEIEVEKTEAPLWERLRDYDGQLDAMNRVSKPSGDDAAIKIKNCSAVASAAQYAESMAIDSMKRLGSKVKSQLIKYQTKYFPAFRKNYGELAANKLWEHDVDVSVSGTKAEYITFTGAMFAANKNVKEAFERIEEDLKTFRFKQARFRWYKGQSDYQYYTLESLKDSDLD